MRRYSAHRLDGNHAGIVNALRKLGCSVMPLTSGVDILVGKSGRNYLFEIKGEKGKLTERESDFIEAWSGQVNVVRSIEDCLRMMK